MEDFQNAMSSSKHRQNIEISMHRMSHILLAGRMKIIKKHKNIEIIQHFTRDKILFHMASLL